MKKILAFAGSNNQNSINHQLIEFTASQITNNKVTILDIRHWNVPMYSINMDPDQTPDKITELITLIKEHDGFIISSPEHNGGTPAFFKNIIDWLSRRGDKVFDNKPLCLLSTSPGARGGASNLNYLVNSLPYQGATVEASFSLPSFFDNFKDGNVQGDQLEGLQECIGKFQGVLNG